LGCKRNARSLQAISAGTLPDSGNAWLAVESKLRASLPKFLTDAVSQASKAARADQLPIAVFHARGTKRMDDLVVMRLSDFVDNFVGGPHAVSTEDAITGQTAREDVAK
jgi:hypothetical protein